MLTRLVDDRTCAVIGSMKPVAYELGVEKIPPVTMHGILMKLACEVVEKVLGCLLKPVSYCVHERTWRFARVHEECYIDYFVSATTAYQKQSRSEYVVRIKIFSAGSKITVRHTIQIKVTTFALGSRRPMSIGSVDVVN